MTGTPITFDIGEISDGGTGDNLGVLADAIIRTAIAIETVSADPIGVRILAERITQVSFAIGTAPNVQVEDRTLIINYVPDQDIAGRPSSRAIERFLEESL